MSEDEWGAFEATGGPDGGGGIGATSLPADVEKADDSATKGDASMRDGAESKSENSAALIPDTGDSWSAFDDLDSGKDAAGWSAFDSAAAVSSAPPTTALNANSAVSESDQEISPSASTSEWGGANDAAIAPETGLLTSEMCSAADAIMEGEGAPEAAPSAAPVAIAEVSLSSPAEVPLSVPASTPVTSSTDEWSGFQAPVEVAGAGHGTADPITTGAAAPDDAWGTFDEAPVPSTPSVAAVNAPVALPPTLAATVTDEWGGFEDAPAANATTTTDAAAQDDAWGAFDDAPAQSAPPIATTTTAESTPTPSPTATANNDGGGVDNASPGAANNNDEWGGFEDTAASSTTMNTAHSQRDVPSVDENLPSSEPSNVPSSTAEVPVARLAVANAGEYVEDATAALVAPVDTVAVAADTAATSAAALDDASGEFSDAPESSTPSTKPDASVVSVPAPTPTPALVSVDAAPIVASGAENTAADAMPPDAWGAFDEAPVSTTLPSNNNDECGGFEEATAARVEAPVATNGAAHVTETAVASDWGEFDEAPTSTAQVSTVEVPVSPARSPAAADTEKPEQPSSPVAANNEERGDFESATTAPAEAAVASNDATDVSATDGEAMASDWGAFGEAPISIAQGSTVEAPVSSTRSPAVADTEKPEQPASPVAANSDEWGDFENETTTPVKAAVASSDVSATDEAAVANSWDPFDVAPRTIAQVSTVGAPVSPTRSPAAADTEKPEQPSSPVAANNDERGDFENAATTSVEAAVASNDATDVTATDEAAVASDWGAFDEAPTSTAQGSTAEAPASPTRSPVVADTEKPEQPASPVAANNNEWGDFEDATATPVGAAVASTDMASTDEAAVASEWGAFDEAPPSTAHVSTVGAPVSPTRNPAAADTEKPEQQSSPVAANNDEWGDFENAAATPVEAAVASNDVTDVTATEAAVASDWGAFDEAPTSTAQVSTVEVPVSPPRSPVVADNDEWSGFGDASATSATATKPVDQASGTQDTGWSAFDDAPAVAPAPSPVVGDKDNDEWGGFGDATAVAAPVAATKPANDISGVKDDAWSAFDDAPAPTSALAAATATAEAAAPTPAPNHQAADNDEWSGFGTVAAPSAAADATKGGADAKDGDWGAFDEAPAPTTASTAPATTAEVSVSSSAPKAPSSPTNDEWDSFEDAGTGAAAALKLAPKPTSSSDEWGGFDDAPPTVEETGAQPNEAASAATFSPFDSAHGATSPHASWKLPLVPHGVNVTNDVGLPAAVNAARVLRMSVVQLLQYSGPTVSKVTAGDISQLRGRAQSSGAILASLKALVSSSSSSSAQPVPQTYDGTKLDDELSSRRNAWTLAAKGEDDIPVHLIGERLWSEDMLLGGLPVINGASAAEWFSLAPLQYQNTSALSPHPPSTPRYQEGKSVAIDARETSASVPQPSKPKEPEATNDQATAEEADVFSSFDHAFAPQKTTDGSMCFVVVVCMRSHVCLCDDDLLDQVTANRNQLQPRLDSTLTFSMTVRQLQPLPLQCTLPPPFLRCCCWVMLGVVMYQIVFSWRFVCESFFNSNNIDCAPCCVSSTGRPP